MSEFRRDLDLPFVVDTNPDVVKELTGIFADVVDTSIPALGIVHDTDVDGFVKYGSSRQRHESVHDWHRNLVMQAVIGADPGMNVSGFSKHISHMNFKHGGTTLHTDGIGTRLDPDTVHSNPSLAMRLRLHTIGTGNPAHAILISSAPGIFSDIGDEEHFGAYDDVNDSAWSAGYDMRGRLFLEEALKAIEAGETDSLRSEPDVYHFDEADYSSVLFRSNSSLGAITLHGFSSDHVGSRHVYASDMHIYSR